jgi:hypothetical protein
MTCRSILELVSWYSANSLKESFSGLDATLVFPYRWKQAVVNLENTPTPVLWGKNMRKGRAKTVRLVEAGRKKSK